MSVELKIIFIHQVLVESKDHPELQEGLATRDLKVNRVMLDLPEIQDYRKYTALLLSDQMFYTRYSFTEDHQDLWDLLV